jgi:hypothetical protein
VAESAHEKPRDPALPLRIPMKPKINHDLLTIAYVYLN